MSFHNEPLPPKPYACVRLCGGDPNRAYQTQRNVPLHWLQDWPRALDTQCQAVLPNSHGCYAPPTGLPVFHCFHSPLGFDAPPTFRDVRLLRDWAAAASKTAAVYTVHVVCIVQPDDDRAYRDAPHAHVRVRDCGTDLTVPVAWLQQWQTLRVDGRTGVVGSGEKSRQWQCFYEVLEPKPQRWRYRPQAKRVLAAEPNVPQLTRFVGGLQRSWYAVQVLRVCEGE